MRSIKTFVNLYRILEFTFRNIRQTIAYSTDSRTSKLPKGIWVERAVLSVLSERSGIFRKALSAPKEIWPLHSLLRSRSHALVGGRRAVGREHSPEELQCWSYECWMCIFPASLAAACLSGSWWSTDRRRWAQRAELVWAGGVMGWSC